MNKTVWGLFAIVPLIIGVIIMAAWVLKIPALLPIDNENTPVFFNAAFGFVLTALGLLVAVTNHPQLKNWQIIFGFFPFLIGALTLAQYIFHVNLDVDQFFVMDWRVTEFDLYPGRMAPNSALIFMGLGFILMVMPFAKYKALGMLIDISLFLVSLIVILALVGHMLNLAFLYDWYSATRLTMIALICFISLKLGIWGVWRREPDARTLYQGSEDYKIILLSSAILLTMAFAITITIVASLIKQEMKTETLKHTKLQQLYANYFSNEVKVVSERADLIVENKLFSNALLSSSPSSAQFQEAIKFIEAEGFQTIQIKKANTTIYNAGTLFAKPSLLVSKKQANKLVELFWQSGWYLRIGFDVRQGYREMKNHD